MSYLFAIGYAILCVALGSLLYKLGLGRAYSRKVVHILVGGEWFILYHTAAGTVHFPIICIILTALLALDYKLRAVPAMQSDGDNAPGTVYYGVAMSILAVASYFYPPLMLPFGIGVPCTSIGDGFAGIVGQLFEGQGKIIGRKTAFGAIANFIASFIDVVLGLTLIFFISS